LLRRKSQAARMTRMGRCHALWISLVPFLFVRTPIGRAVFANGVLAHGTQHELAVRFDIACNLAFAAYVNCTSSYQPQTLGLSAVALLAWLWNRRHAKRPLVHAALVQLPLLCAAARF